MYGVPAAAFAVDPRAGMLYLVQPTPFTGGIMPRAPLLVVAFALLASTFSSTRLHAQVHGLVRDGSGEPFPSVLVELWGEGGRLATRMTDGEGRFSFPEDQSRSATGLTAAHIGHRTVRTELSSSTGPLELRMEILPIALPELTVAEAMRACPNRDEEAARRLWQAVRERYTTTTARRGIAFEGLRAREDLVSADRVGVYDETRLKPYRYRQVGATETPSPERFLDVNVRIRQEGYGSRARTSDERWRLTGLDGTHAHHFASDVFGERHTLSIVAEEPNEVVIAFCPRRNDQPEIEGLLVIDRDTSFASAQWRFLTPAPRTDAGGEVVFTPWNNGTGARPHLLAARGLYWRRHPKWTDRFHVRATVYTSWAVSDTDAMPDLPRRDGR